MSIEEQIKEILTENLQPHLLEVYNESHKHAGHTSSPGTGQSHFKVLVVSDKFEGKSKVARHQMIYDCLKLFLLLRKKNKLLLRIGVNR